MMHRRDLLNAAMVVGGASLFRSDSLRSEDKPSETKSAASLRVIDTNISLFQWPFRRLPLDDTDTLVKRLGSLGISEAWAGSFEGILHRDVAGVNKRLAEVCGRYPELVAIGSVNLELPGWESDLQRCIREYSMPGIRLHPNYHGYTLADPRFRLLLERASSAAWFIQLAVAMEDIRTQHPLVQVPDVDLALLPNLMPRHAGAVVQLLNYRPSGQLLDKLAETPGVLFDSSRVESTDGIGRLMQSVGRERVMLGTHAPFLIPEAALIRTHESNLGEEELRLLLSANAQQTRKRGI